MLRIWLADHERVSSCNGLLDFPLARQLEALELSGDCKELHVMLLLEDIAPPYSSKAVCCALIRLSVES